MGERIAAEIFVGGKIRKRQLSRLLEAVIKDGARRDWGDATPTTVDELLACRKEGWIWLCHEEASYGTFPELEQFCLTGGLAFNRCTEPQFEYDRSLAFVRHAKGGRIRDGSVYINAAQHRLIPEASLRKVLGRMQTAIGHRARPLQQLKAAAQALIAVLESVPPLPVFEVVQKVSSKSARRAKVLKESIAIQGEP